MQHISYVQVVRSVLWPSEQCPVYFTAGEDGSIRSWSALAGDGDSAMGVPRKGAQTGAGRQRKRPRPDAA